MKKYILFIIVIYFLLNRNIHAWWDHSWSHCRDIEIKPTNPDFNRDKELIEIWINESEVLPNCSDIRIVDKSCSEIGNEVPRYIEYGENSNCKINFEVDRGVNEIITYSVYYGNPLAPDSQISEGFEIWGDNFERDFMEPKWNITSSNFDSNEFCNINFSRKDETDRILQMHLHGGRSECNNDNSCWCVVDSIKKFSGPISLFIRTSYDTIRGDRNHGVVYTLNISMHNPSTDWDYFEFLNILRDDCCSGHNPKTVLMGGENDDGPPPCPSTWCTCCAHLPEQLELKLLDDPFDDGIFHDLGFLYDSETRTYSFYVDGTKYYDYILTPGNENWNQNFVRLQLNAWDIGNDQYAEFDEVCIVTRPHFCHVYDNPSIVILKPEQVISKLLVSMRVEKNLYLDQESTIITKVEYDNDPIINLTSSNFKLFLDENEPSISNLHNHNNGTYSFSSVLSSKNLGSHNLTTRVEYEGDYGEDQKSITLLKTPESKPLIITNKNWKDYIPSVTTNNPVLVYDSNRDFIDYFISEYRPEEVYQLGTNIPLPVNTYYVDSSETLAKIFFNSSNLIIPSNKETSIAASMLDLPILLNPLEETIEFLNPQKIYNFSSINDIEYTFKENNPEPDYFILTHPNDENSMFAASLAINKNAFIILLDKSATQTKNILKEKFEEFDIPESYVFDQDIHLALIGNIPYFPVLDPINVSKNIQTDTLYADINDDDFLDLSVGRLSGNPEYLSYLIESSRIFETDKTALILASYNTPGKYFDVLTAGGTMPNVMNTELTLLLKGFKTTRLVEKRSEFDELNMDILEILHKITENLGIITATHYTSLFSELLGDVSKIFLVARAGDTILYSIYEFDWVDTWRSILNQEPRYPKHLPVLNEPNLMENIPENQVIVYLSKGNETHWFIPENSSAFKTTYSTFDPSRIPFNPAFFYLRYSNSLNMFEKIQQKGILGLIGHTGDTYYIESGQTAYHFFKNFDETIGKSLSLTKNRNLELDNFINQSPHVYKKEYYTPNLLGDPSLILDPELELKQTESVQTEGDTFIIKFSVEPDYSLIEFNNTSFLVFNDADDYLLTNNKPIIPLYKRSFILPTDSTISDISVETKSKKVYGNVFIPISIPDPEFFDNETFEGSFPEEFYWNGTIKLLDNRKVFDILFSPIKYFDNNTAEVFEEMEVTLKYQSNLEIINLTAEDVMQGDATRILFDTYNNLGETISINIITEIQNEDSKEVIEKQFDIKPGLSSLSIEYGNTTNVGNYSVSLALTYNDYVTGPRYTYFEVRRKSIVWRFLLPSIRRFFYGITGFFKETKTFRETYTVKKEGDKIVLDYVSLNLSLHIEKSDKLTKSILTVKDGKLIIEQQPKGLKYTVTSPDGVLEIIKEKGKYRESGKGDSEKLRNLLNEMISIYREELFILNLTS